MKVRIEVEGEPYDVAIERADGGFRITCEDETLDIDVLEPGPPARLRAKGHPHVVDVLSDDAASLDGVPCRFHVARFEPGEAAGAAGGRTAVHAVMPGRIVRLLVAVGARVRKGDPLLVLEAMKMQNELLSPIEGRVAEVLASEGDVVEAGRVLARLEPEGEARAADRASA